MVIQMGVNRCVSCGKIMPEGDHICKQCLEGTVGEKRLVINEMLEIKLEPVMLSFHNVDVKIENYTLLFECLVKYYIFKTNMYQDGTFDYGFIRSNVQENEDLPTCETRLFDEYTRTVELIESMFIKK